MIEMSNWEWPQWAIILLSLVAVAIAFGKNGQPRPPFNGAGTLIGRLIMAVILTAGGFFR